MISLSPSLSTYIYIYIYICMYIEIHEISPKSLAPLDWHAISSRTKSQRV